MDFFPLGEADMVGTPRPLPLTENRWKFSPYNGPKKLKLAFLDQNYLSFGKIFP